VFATPMPEMEEKLLSIFKEKRNREPNTEKEAAFCGKGIEIEKTQTEMEKQPREPFPTETEVAGKINTKNF
jgi:hypothetical protein